ncbi:hypothetical protein SNE40_010426 [Patella caerulea]|uniref:Arrestin C-terminal-like domain-containing protein n=1 Tax=Patella caerulea TaxID=87958 RepID=A0AAN8PUK0_PATCE
MGSLSTFEVIIFNHNGVCEPGDKLEGEVIVENTRPMKIKEIRLESSGIAHVHWVDTRNAEGSVEPESADEQYYKCTETLFPQQEENVVPNSLRIGDGYHELQPGHHSFPFKFPIPPKLPCSFEGPYGHVRYFLKAIIEKPWKLKVNTRPFTVKSRLDLNNIPHCSEELVKSSNIQLSSILFSTGSCFASLHLSKRGFIPGEEIPVNIFIKNDSKLNIRSCTLALKMILHYETPSQSRRTTINLAKVKLDKVRAESTSDTFNNSLRIPADLPPNLNGCGLINVRYVLLLKMKPSFMSLSCLKIPVEIVIGTIPINPSTLSLSHPPPSYIEVMTSESNALPNYQDAIITYPVAPL